MARHIISLSLTGWPTTQDPHLWLSSQTFNISIFDRVTDQINLINLSLTGWPTIWYLHLWPWPTTWHPQFSLLNDWLFSFPTSTSWSSIQKRLVNIFMSSFRNTRNFWVNIPAPYLRHPMDVAYVCLKTSDRTPPLFRCMTVCILFGATIYAYRASRFQLD